MRAAALRQLSHYASRHYGFEWADGDDRRACCEAGESLTRYGCRACGAQSNGVAATAAVCPNCDAPELAPLPGIAVIAEHR